MKRIIFATDGAFFRLPYQAVIDRLEQECQGELDSLVSQCQGPDLRLDQMSATDNLTESVLSVLMELLSADVKADSFCLTCEKPYPFADLVVESPLQGASRSTTDASKIKKLFGLSKHAHVPVTNGITRIFCPEGHEILARRTMIF